MKFNTAIAQLMTLVNQFNQNKPSRGDLKALLELLSPFAPHIVEELWEIQQFDEKMACQQSWPEYDEEKTVDSNVEIAVQINGKVKSKLTIPMDADEDSVYEAVMADEKIQKATDGMNIIKRIYIKNRLMNVIVKPQ